jgi:hypothetical protein
MAFELFCATLVALLFGTAVVFGGYRLFLILLPLWGFFFGFGVGAQAITALAGVGLFATVTSWVVGFFIGAIFALLSYLFYAVAVAIIAGSLGYIIGVGLMGLFGLTTANFLTWAVAIALAVVVILVTFRFNLQKYVIIIATAVGGAGLIVSTLLLGIGGTSLAQLAENPIRLMLQTGSFWATLLFLVLAVAGIGVQMWANRNWEVQMYNRYTGMDGTDTETTEAVF